MKWPRACGTSTTATSRTSRDHTKTFSFSSSARPRWPWPAADGGKYLSTLFCDDLQLRRGDGGGLANDQFRLNQDFRLVGVASLDPIEQGFRSDLPHALERLLDGGQTRLAETGVGDVVESDDRNILGDAQPGILKQTHRADGGNVVESKERCEGLAARD